MRDRFLISRAAHGTIAGAHAVVAGGSGQPGLGEVIGQELRLVRRQLRKAPFKRTRDALVPFAPATQQQALIGRVPQQRVLEAEASLQAAPLGKDDARRDELVQRGVEHGAVPRSDGRKQREGELPADDGSDLRHLARLVEAVEPCHQ
jgi:hypothetical protein